MTHAAAISLKTLMWVYSSAYGFINTHCPPTHLLSLNDMATSIQTFDFEENGVQEKNLEKEIRDALWRAEDIIESYILNNLLSPEDFSKDLLKVIQEIESIKEKIDKLAEDLKHDKEISDYVIPPIDDLLPLHKNKMVGLDKELKNMKEIILGTQCFLRLGAIGIYGMGGIGKTSFAISIYNDLDVRSHFSIGAWVKISLQHCVRSILLSLWHTTEFFDNGKVKDMNKSIMIEDMDDEELANFVCAFFMTQRYIVIVDCLCDINLRSWNYIKSILPDSNDGSRILLVSRMRLKSDREFFLYYFVKGILNESQSWNLLREQVFGDEPCPDAMLEKIGKRIAENCQGLPLAIVTVGVHLAKEEKTLQYWNKVAESGNSVAYAADGSQMFEQVGLSYMEMPPRLRSIFLYMGAFQENERIAIKEVQSLWIAEALLDLEEFVTPENMFLELFEYLLDRDVLMDIREHNIEKMKWSLHHAMWHFCCSQAKKEEFFHAFDKYTNDGEDSNINRELRRVVIRKSMLFGITEFIEKIEHSMLSARSMLFTGPYNPYPLMISWGSYKMLRVLDACSVRFYEFPTEILHLKLLRYLALTLNGGDLPHGISKLRHLLYLIVKFHHTVRSYDGGPSYLPIDIWEMQQLVHLQVMGCDLPPPPHSYSFLPKLVTLWDVSPHSCIKEVLERIPNLRRLKISIDLALKRNSAPIWLFDHNFPLAYLHTANVAITNPYFEDNIGPQVVAMSEIFSFSMKDIQNLSLSGCGFSWESIEPISQLPFLVDLKLQSHAFRGPIWKLISTGFSKLQSLILEDLDLIYWTTGSEDHIFPCLQMVTITKCHKLEQIPLNFIHCHNLFQIIVEDSSKAAETWARTTALSETRKRQLIVASQRGKESIRFWN